MNKKELIKELPIRISTGNSKLGQRVYNINLPPISACIADAPCIKECYAMKAWVQYPNVREAWGLNLETYRHDPSQYFGAIYDYLMIHPNMKLFRWHSAGDMPDANYWLGVQQIAAAFPRISFMIFTKQYKFDYTSAPKNLNVIISTWPGMDVPDVSTENSAHKLPWAWIDEDPRAPDQHVFRCPGKCDECGYECWENKTLDVVFKLH